MSRVEYAWTACKISNKQYSGQTTDSFRSRWNNYKYKSRKFDKNEKYM